MQIPPAEAVHGSNDTAQTSFGFEVSRGGTVKKWSLAGGGKIRAGVLPDPVRSRQF